MKSDIGHTLGGQIELYLEGLCLRGFYSAGRYEYEKCGVANNSVLGADFGISEPQVERSGFLYIGFRNLKSKREYIEKFEVDNSVLELAEWIVGLSFKSTPLKKGFIFNIETILSIQGLINYLKEKEGHKTADIIIEVGHRFRVIPLSVFGGIEANVYQFKYKRPPYGHIRFADFYPKEIDATYGITIRLAYTFVL